MPKQCFLFAWIIFSCSLFADAADPKVIWRKQFGDRSTTDVAIDVAIDSKENVIVGGTIGKKGYVRKYDAKGEILWKFQLDSLYDISGNAVNGVAVDEDDFIYYAGFANRLHENNDYWPKRASMCYGKLSPAGKLVTSYRHEVIRRSGIADIAKGEGMFVIGGFMKGGYSKNGYRETSGTFIGLLNNELKLRKRKDHDKSKTYTSRFARHGTKKNITGVAFMSDGGVAVAGSDSTTGDFHRYVQRRAKALGVRWTQRLTYQGWFASGSPAIAVDSQDNIYVALSYNEKGETDDHLYVAKYSPEGELLQEHKLPSKKQDAAHRMAIAADDSVLVSCTYNDRPAITRITSAGAMSSKPFYLYPRKQADRGAAWSVCIGPDKTIYVDGQMRGHLVEGDIEEGAAANGPYSMYDTSSPYAFLVKLTWDGITLTE